MCIHKYSMKCISSLFKFDTLKKTKDSRSKMIRLKLSHSKWQSHNLIVKCPTLSLARRWHRDWEPPHPPPSTLTHGPSYAIRKAQDPMGWGTPCSKMKNFKPGTGQGPAEHEALRDRSRPRPPAVHPTMRHRASMHLSTTSSEMPHAPTLVSDI